MVERCTKSHCGGRWAHARARDDHAALILDAKTAKLDAVAV